MGHPCEVLINPAIVVVPTGLPCEALNPALRVILIGRQVVTLRPSETVVPTGCPVDTLKPAAQVVPIGQPIDTAFSQIISSITLLLHFRYLWALFLSTWTSISPHCKNNSAHNVINFDSLCCHKIKYKVTFGVNIALTCVLK